MTDKPDNAIVQERNEVPALQSEALQLMQNQDNKSVNPVQNTREEEKSSNLPKMDIVDPNMKDFRDFKDLKNPREGDKSNRETVGKAIAEQMAKWDPVIDGTPTIGKDGKITMEHSVPKEKMDKFVDDLKDGELSKENLDYLKKVLEKGGAERLQWLVGKVNNELAERDVHTRLGVESKLEQTSWQDRNINGKGPLEQNTYVTVAHLKDGNGGFSFKEMKIGSKDFEMPTKPELKPPYPNKDILPIRLPHHNPPQLPEPVRIPQPPKNEIPKPVPYPIPPRMPEPVRIPQLPKDQAPEPKQKPVYEKYQKRY